MSKESKHVVKYREAHLKPNEEIVAWGEGTAVLSTENLMTAYGGHMHVVGDDMLLADTCCDHGEEL